MIPTLANADLDLPRVLMGLFGGLALFLFGMDHLADALKRVAGNRIKYVLAKLTTNRFMAVLTGASVTAIIQSSSVTTVLVVGFITAGLMSMSQSIGVIMGANIGTTVTAQIVAFKVTDYALLLIAAGFALEFFTKAERLRHQGQLILGLGLVFFGMSVMGDSMRPLRSYQPFLDGMTRMENPALGILAGTIFTAVVQSSSATTGVVITLAMSGFLTLPAGIAIIFGANIGTCVTAILASIGKPREALRAAAVHVVYNVLGVVMWVAFIDQLADLVQWMSPAAAELDGQARRAAETPRQIANAHTVFNIANTVLLVGFAPQFARLVQWIVPDRPLAEEEEVRAKYLDSELLDTPSLALDRARLELLHLGDHVEKMLAESLPAVLSGSRERLEKLRKMDDAVDTLHGHIVTYLGKVSQGELSESQTEEFISLLEAAHDLENIGDIIETNLVALGRQRINGRLIVSDATRGVLEEFHATVVKALSAALQAVTQQQTDAARVVVSMKAEVNRQAGTAAKHEARRLVAEEPNRLQTYAFEMDVLENLKRVYYFCKRMARIVLRSETNGADAE